MRINSNSVEAEDKMQEAIAGESKQNRSVRSSIPTSVTSAEIESTEGAEVDDLVSHIVEADNDTVRDL